MNETEIEKRQILVTHLEDGTTRVECEGNAVLCNETEVDVTIREVARLALGKTPEDDFDASEHFTILVAAGDTPTETSTLEGEGTL